MLDFCEIKTHFTVILIACWQSWKYTFWQTFSKWNKCHTFIVISIFNLGLIARNQVNVSVLCLHSHRSQAWHPAFFLQTTLVSHLLWSQMLFNVFWDVDICGCRASFSDWLSYSRSYWLSLCSRNRFVYHSCCSLSLSGQNVPP